MGGGRVVHSSISFPFELHLPAPRNSGLQLVSPSSKDLGKEYEEPVPAVGLGGGGGDTLSHSCSFPAGLHLEGVLSKQVLGNL